jgi:hypothetical protein
MAERKTTTGKSREQQGPAIPTPVPPERPAEAATGAKEGRKPWVKKTPVEVVLEQIGNRKTR